LSFQYQDSTYPFLVWPAAWLCLQEYKWRMNVPPNLRLIRTSPSNPHLNPFSSHPISEVRCLIHARKSLAKRHWLLRPLFDLTDTLWQDLGMPHSAPKTPLLGLRFGDNPWIKFSALYTVDRNPE
jgi:hypothetical protein